MEELKSQNNVENEVEDFSEI